MLRVFRRLSSFAGDEQAFTRWVFTIARNLLIDAHRSAQRRPNVSSAGVPERPTRSTEEVALEQLTGAELVSLLDRLSIDQREVIALRVLDDLSLADVAAVVGRSVAAVKGLQRRGLRRLEAELSARSARS